MPIKQIDTAEGAVFFDPAHDPEKCSGVRIGAGGEITGVVYSNPSDELIEIGGPPDVTPEGERYHVAPARAYLMQDTRSSVAAFLHAGIKMTPREQMDPQDAVKDAIARHDAEDKKRIRRIMKKEQKKVEAGESSPDIARQRIINAAARDIVNRVYEGQKDAIDSLERTDEFRNLQEFPAGLFPAIAAYAAQQGLIPASSRHGKG